MSNLSMPATTVNHAIQRAGNAGNDGERAARDAADARVVQQLKRRDQEVRQHERAHATAASGIALGPPRYDYTRGPDGRRYAIGGEVQIDVAPVPNDPRATVEKAGKIRRAALAPANPSQQDRAVAARASAMAMEARLELAREEREARSADRAGGADPAGSATGRSALGEYGRTQGARPPALDAQA